MPLNYIVFAGGGAKTIAYAGALSVLKNSVPLYSLKGIAGTSAGAIFALMLTLKYTTEEITKMMMENNFSEMGSDIKLLNIISSENCGMSDGKKLLNWIHQIIESKNIDKNITFLKLYELTGVHLVVTGTNLNRETTTYFSYETFPEMSVAKAIQVSSSYPFIYQVQKVSGEYYTDGGVLNNFPINVFPENETLGLSLYGNLKENGHFVEIKSRVDIFFRLLVVGVNHQSTQKLNLKNTIYITLDPNIDSMDYSISKKQKLNLISSGMESVVKFFENARNSRKKIK